MNIQEQEERDYRPSTDAEWDRAEAYERGSYKPDCQWVLTDRDVWHKNPHYSGPDQRHPEDEDYEEISPEDASLFATEAYAMNRRKK